MLTLSDDAKAAGFTLAALPLTASTNQDALENTRAGVDRRWVVAEAQAAGRGRHGRDWLSPPGNLYASLGLIAPCAPQDAPRLGFVAGVALAEAICDLAPTMRGTLRLKWPNDLLVNGAKCSGMLLEGAILPGQIQAVAIGVGVNVAHVPPGLDQAATCLADHAPHITRDSLFEHLSHHMAAAIEVFAHGKGFEQIRMQWLAHALPMGERLRVRPPQGERYGTFAGIDEAGHLLLATDTGVDTIMVGDVLLAEPD